MGGPDPHGRDNFEGKDVPRHARRHSAVNCAKVAEFDRHAVWVVGIVDGLKEPRIRLGSDPHARAIFRGQDMSIVMPGDTLPSLPVSWAKRLNRSRCHLGCGLVWADGSIVLHMGHIGATWRVRRRCGLVSKYFDHLFVVFKRLSNITYIKYKYN